ncbi:MAG: type II toxin-antitoxin system HicB family antitoxin [Gemmatimonadaceae bacterium]|nr:type II toxin-antitoxin system HicB family antitoxin [Gloeobacterales cyanobacterium ES-bin-141]
MENPRYTVVIRWSDEDRAYLVELPEFAATVMQPVTHGDTYEQALKHGLEVLETLIEMYREEGRPLPPLPVREVA